MEIFKDVPRWIVASAANHFKTRCIPLKFYMESQPRLDPNSDLIEFRIDGPFLRLKSYNYYTADAEINILIQSVESDTDMYKIHKDAGIVLAAFTSFIVYKHGDGPGDNNTILGSMELDMSSPTKDIIYVHHYGQVSADVKIFQATVEARFKMDITI